MLRQNRHDDLDKSRHEAADRRMMRDQILDWIYMIRLLRATRWIDAEKARPPKALQVPPEVRS